MGDAHQSPNRAYAVGITAIAALAALVSTWLSLQFRVGDAELSSLWLANGVILAVLLASPQRRWPALLIASLLSLTAIDAFYLDGAHPTSAINVFEAFLGALLIRRFAGPIGSLMSLKRLLASFACVLGVAAPVGAALGTLAVRVSTPDLDSAEFFRIWLFSDALGLIIVSPALHAIEAKRLALPDFERMSASRFETWVFWLVFLTASIPVMSVEPDPGRNLGDLHYGLFPLLLWAAFRLEPWVSLNAVLFVSAWAAWQTASGAGPFVMDGQSDAGRILAYQIPTLTTAMSVQTLLVLSNERRHAARRLRETSEKFRNIVETTNEWLWELDTRLVCTYSSPHCKQMIGYEPDELVGKSLYDIIHEDDEERLRELLRTSIAARTPVFNFAHRQWRKDGSIVHVETNAVPILDEEGELMGYRGAHRDVTARVEAEARQRSRQESNARADKLIALGTVVSGVAHEINNPNQFISSNLPVLRRAWEDVEPAILSHSERDGAWTIAGLPTSEAVAEIRDIIDEITDGSDRIRTIVAELGDYVRGESNYSFEPLIANSVVETTARLLRGTLGSRGHRLELELDPDPPTILGNASRIEQVLINLVTNASDALVAMQDPGPIRITTGPTSEKGRYPIFVEDEGAGIEPEDLDRVLDPFFSTKRERGGTGLGLAISSRIAKEHQGSLDLEPRVGGGTRATFWLPLADEA